MRVATADAFAFSGENRNMKKQFRTVAEVAEMLGVSRDTVRRLFADEPGVIDLGRREATRDKRRYRLLRIPSAIVARFLENRSVKKAPVRGGSTEEPK